MHTEYEMREHPEQLFCLNDFSRIFIELSLKISQEIFSLDFDSLLNTNPEDLADYFEQKYRLESVKINESDIKVYQESTRIDMTGEADRCVIDNSKHPYYFRGTLFSYHVPFSGDKELFQVRPIHGIYPRGDSPRAIIKENHLILEFETATNDLEYIRIEFFHELDEIKKWLSWLEADIKLYNDEIKIIALSEIRKMRQRLFKVKGLVSDLDFTIQKRNYIPFVVPDIKRQLHPVLPPMEDAPYFCGPALEIEKYENILSIISDTVAVISRSPHVFRSLSEEAIRNHFIIPLNAQYEGMVNGELFIFSGKTDIQLRERGKNVFTAECKFWRGPKALLDNINQLLQYSSWADGKLALLVFSRDRLFPSVVAKIPKAVRTHPNFYKQIDCEPENGFRFILTYPDDILKEVVLTVLVFEIPS